MAGYLAIAASDPSAASSLVALRDKVRALGWGVVAEADGVVLLVEDPNACVPIGAGSGVLLGQVWSRADGYARCQGLDEVEAGTLVSTAGRALLTRYWGRYVAFVLSKARGTIHVVRDPSGALPCYAYRHGGLDILSDDLRMAVRLDLIRPAIDWGFISQHIAFGGLRVARTGLVGVQELLPGMAVALGPSLRRELYWRPGDFAAPDMEISDPEEAADQVREETVRCVAALASAFPKIVLELSGGLDSSIVAACLAGRADVQAINCATERPEGDEREFARLVADATGFPLREVMLGSAAFQVLKPSAPHLPRPGRTGALEAIDTAFVGFGREVGADAFFSGGGGDNVFCFLKSAAPVVDRFRRQGLTLGLAETVFDIARLHSTSGWAVARQAWKIGSRSGGAPPDRPKRDFLCREAIPEQPEPHPWFTAGGLNQPGRHRHLYSIAWILGLTDGHDRAAYAPMIFPLLSQPLVEMCLRAPTWLWVANGRDRAVARAAFSDKLPAAVLERRTKGRIDRQIALAYDLQRASIADLLIDGVLARNGVVDSGAVERAVRHPLEKGASFMTLLELADAELWARGWLDHRPAV